MAKGIGLVGTLSGRSGNFVFSKGMNGKTIVRPYQPIVANPNTSAQRDARARFLAATSMANKVTDLALVGMKSAARSAGISVKNAMAQQVLRGGASNFTRTEAAGVVTMAIKNDAFRALQFSKGSVGVVFDDSVMRNDPDNDFHQTGTIKTTIPAADANQYKVVMVARAEKTGRFMAKVFNLSAVTQPVDEYETQFDASFYFNVMEEGTGVMYWGYFVKADEGASTSYLAIPDGAEAISSEVLAGASYSPTTFLGSYSLPN